MSGLLAAAFLATRAVGVATTGSDEGAVYQYRDSAGVDHYVNHPEMVPKGVSSTRVDLSESQLNPELAHEIAESAHRAAEEAKARTAEHAAGAKEDPNPAPAPAVLPPEARLVLIWALAFTVAFLILWLTGGLLLRRSRPLAAAFLPLRWGCGAAALLSWMLLATVARGWIGDHCPPLRSLEQAQRGVDKINREHRESERELDKALNGK